MRMGTSWNLLGGSLSGTFEEGGGRGGGWRGNGLIPPGWREEDKAWEPKMGRQTPLQRG